MLKKRNKSEVSVQRKGILTDSGNRIRGGRAWLATTIWTSPSKNTVPRTSKEGVSS